MLIDKFLFRFFSYSCYFWKAQSILYIHSPFVFGWVNCIQLLQAQNDIAVENYRKNLECNRNLFEYVLKGNKVKTQVYKRYKITSITDDYGKILTATMIYLKANYFLELGTSFGVSTAYLVSRTREARGLSIDFNEQAILMAQSMFDKHFVGHRVKFIHGYFNEILNKVLTNDLKLDFIFIDGDHSYKSTINYVKMVLPFMSEKAVIALDDIRWNKDMYKAWSEILLFPEFNYTIDYGRIGFLFKVNNHSPKQHFVLK